MSHAPPSILHRLAGVDLRALAAFRIGLAIAMLWDGLVSLENARAFYAEDGVMPASLLAQMRESVWVWSLHGLSGGAAWQMILIVLQLAATLCLLIGCRTQLALLIAWLLMASLQARNPLILHGGDTAMRVLGFWALFLPLGARWSVDALRGKGGTFVSSGYVFSAASLGLLMQVAMIYWFTAMLKHGNEWTRDGTAVYYALSVDQFVKPAGLWLLQFPQTCRALTFAIWWLEVLGPFVAFIPIRSGVIRVAVVLAFWLLHLGLGLCLRLGPFPLIMIVAWIPFLPAGFWDFIERKMRPQERGRPRPQPTKSWMSHPITQTFSLIMLAYVALWNLRSVDQKAWEPFLPRALNPIGYTLRVEQWWALFSPKPLTDDGWLILDARDPVSGSQIDLLREGKPVSFEKPASISAEYADHKWQKLMMNIWLAKFQRARPAFVQWWLKKWQEEHASAPPITEWTLIYMREETLPHYYAIRPQRVEIASSKD
jgi:hypothetical protein